MYTFTVEQAEDGQAKVVIDGRIGDVIPDTYSFPNPESLSAFIGMLLGHGYKQVLTQAKQEELIAEWNRADQQQKFWKDKEKTLRDKVVSEFYTKDKGTQNVALRDDWTLKIERSEDYKLENSNGETEDVLEEFDDATAKLLVKWKPEINKKNFDALSEENKAKFNAVLTIKPSSPQVKLIPPKVQPK